MKLLDMLAALPAPEPRVPSPRVAPVSAPAALKPCPHRGVKIGERDCTTCGNRKTRLHVFACPRHAEGVTWRDCFRCPPLQETDPC